MQRPPVCCWRPGVGQGLGVLLDGCQRGPQPCSTGAPLNSTVGDCRASMTTNSSRILQVLFCLLAVSFPRAPPEPNLLPQPCTWQQEPFCTHLCCRCPVVLTVPQGSGAGSRGPLGAPPARHALAVELQDACGDALDVQQVIQASEALQLLRRGKSALSRTESLLLPEPPAQAAPKGRVTALRKGGSNPKLTAAVGALCPPDEQDGERGCSSRAGQQLDTCRCTGVRDLGHYPALAWDQLPPVTRCHGRNPAGPGCPGAGLGRQPTQPTGPGRAGQALLTRQGSFYGAPTAPHKGLQ